MITKFNTLRISEDIIASQFQNENQQHIVLLKLYRLVQPNFDKIQKFIGWPCCNNFTWQEICKMFISFDKKNHPDVLSGGCWMNSGFTIDNNLDNWQFQPCEEFRLYGDKNPVKDITIQYSWVDSRNAKQIRISIHRKFSHKSYTIKHFSKFARLLKDMGFILKSSKSPKYYYFERI